ncbi:MAG: ABC transporter permease [Firmicutes bacterium]|nr:ABC transporter permease [Bacillota bacterium]
MATYMTKRIIYMLITLFGISIISFAVIQLPPGDYLTSYITQLQAAGTVVDEAQIESLRRRYGLDKPIYMQYIKWVTGIFRGDFGRSFEWNESVRVLLGERLPLTIAISLATLIFTYCLAIPIGIYSAVRQYSWGDYLATFIGFIGLSIPDFLLALILMFLFYHLFGVSIGGLFSVAFEDAPWSWAKFKDMMDHLWVPMIVIGMSGTAGLIRTMRATTLDELGKDYVKMARSKGLPEWKVILKHPVRVAINPIVSTVGWELPRVVSGETIVAVVLSLPTTGPLLLQALLAQDMFLAGSFIMMLSVLTVIGTLISDFLLAIIDPRIRLE